MAAIRDLQSLYAPYKKFEPSDVEELKQLLFQEVEEHFNQLISDYENSKRLAEDIDEFSDLLEQCEDEDQTLVAETSDQERIKWAKEFPRVFPTPPTLPGELTLKKLFEQMFSVKHTEIDVCDARTSSHRESTNFSQSTHFSQSAGLPLSKSSTASLRSVSSIQSGPISKVDYWIEDSNFAEDIHSNADSTPTESVHSVQKTYGRLKVTSPLNSKPAYSTTPPRRGRVLQQSRNIQPSRVPDTEPAYLNEHAELLIGIQEYCLKSNLKYPEQVPYHDLKLVNLQTLTDLGKKHKNQIKITQSTSQPNESWENVIKTEFFLYANEIKRNGNMGTDKGSMSGAVDAKCNFIDGEPNEYLVMERGNSRVQSFKASKPGREIDLLDHFYLYTGDGNQGKMPLLINARWLVACQYQGTESFHVDHYFIATHIDTEDKQVIKHYDEHFEKIKELKPGQKGITSKGYAIAVVMGDMEDQDPKLVHIRQVKGKKNYYWQLQRYRLSQNTFVRMDSIEIDFLTRINNFEDKSFISYMTSWSNQLYISDSGRHVVYLTDLNGRLRKVVGDDTFSRSDDEGKFNKPGSITVDSKGNFLVADTGNNRVQAFSKDGVFLSVVEIGFVRKPGGLQLDDNGRLFMLSMQDQEVYAMKLSHMSENHQYERPMSKGSQNFFKMSDQNDGKRNGRRGGMRGRGGIGGQSWDNRSGFGSENGSVSTARGQPARRYGRGRGRGWANTQPTQNNEDGSHG